MINFFTNKIINILVIIFLGVQAFIFFFNQKPLYKNFSQKSITVDQVYNSVMDYLNNKK